MGALRARRGLAFSADGRSRASAYNSSARGPSARALGIFAVESTLATKGDEIGVAQQPTALAPFFDGRVRRSHLCNRVVIRGLAQPGRGVSFPCTASILIVAGEPGLAPPPNPHFPGSTACRNQRSEAPSKRLKGCDFLCETRARCQAAEDGTRPQAERRKSLGCLRGLDWTSVSVQRGHSHDGPAVVNPEGPLASEAVV
jgi:hypothetical protein